MTMELNHVCVCVCACACACVCVCVRVCVHILRVLMFMYYYTVCYFTCIFYAVVRQISMLFIDNKVSVFCVRMCVCVCVCV